ncbi:hypothetical protein MBENS4_1034 [Novosphingobium sp. MBES04]|nr:hypothetical protein MBENS4_1034 [Novosphingobium sp. MBES04]
MSASADVLAASTTEVDISSVQTGQAIKAIFRKQPVFIRNLTQREIDAANAVDAASLRDPQTLEERTKEGKTNWLITMGVCTHLGCVPLAPAKVSRAVSSVGISAPATVRTTTPPPVSVRALRP